MRKSLVFLIITVIVSGCNNQAKSNSEEKLNEKSNIKTVNLYNTSWEGEYTSDSDTLKGYLNFDNEGYANFKFEGKGVSGEYIMNISELHEYSGYFYLTGVQWVQKPEEKDWKFNKLIGGVTNDYMVGSVVNESNNILVGTFEFNKVNK